VQFLSTGRCFALEAVQTPLSDLLNCIKDRHLSRRIPLIIFLFPLPGEETDQAGEHGTNPQIKRIKHWVRGEKVWSKFDLISSARSIFIKEGGMLKNLLLLCLLAMVALSVASTLSFQVSSLPCQ
jgi:hypothetical protein